MTCPACKETPLVCRCEVWCEECGCWTNHGAHPVPEAGAPEPLSPAWGPVLDMVDQEERG